MDFSAVMRLLSTFIFFYLVLIILRIALSYIRVESSSYFSNILIRVTEPFLKFLRKFSWSRIRGIDLSIFIAIILLNALANITSELARTGRFSFGIIVAIVISGVWSFLSFLLFFFLIIIAIRAISLSSSKSRTTPLWASLDILINPMLAMLNKVLKISLKPNQTLLILCLILLAVLLAGGILIRIITGILYSLPV